MAAPQTLARIAEDLEQALSAAADCVSRLTTVHRGIAANAPHPGVAQLVQALREVAGVLDRFDLPAAAQAHTQGDPQAAATGHFDAAFDETLWRVHEMRREVARAVVASAARGHALLPHVVQLRRELLALEPHVQAAGTLAQRLVDPGRTIPSGSAWLAMSARAERANALRDLHAAGRAAMEALRDGEEAFAALIVRLKRELAPTYVEWKRLLAPVAMRAFTPAPQALSLAEAREVHLLLQRQVRVACEAAAAFDGQQRRLDDAVRRLGECAARLAQA